MIQSRQMSENTRGLEDPAVVLRGAAACAVQAPSSHNTQPWRFELHDGALDFLSDDSRHLSVIDPLRRQMIMSCGCALYNARVAVRAAGFRDQVTVFPDEARPEVLARLRLGLRRGATADDLARLSALPRRRTNRRPFLDRPVSSEISDELARVARTERTWMIRLEPDRKQTFAELVAEADRRQFDDPEFRAELARWLAPAGSLREDGIPFAEKEYGSSMPFSVLRRLRSNDLGERFGEMERERIEGAPLVAILATEADDPVDWLDCGQALEAVLLRATMFGLAASFLNQVLEVPALALRVDKLMGSDNIAQMVLRIGWAPQVEHPSPRRDLDRVLRES
jgi:hypothetical protein